MKKLVFIALCAAPLAAQAPAPRLVAAPDAQSKPIFGAVSVVRALPNGSVLVNDIAKRQLSLLDPSLANATVVADSVSGTASSYGVRPGGLIAYLADSSLFVDPAGLSMFVIDPSGKIARVASVPRSQDAGAIGSIGPNLPALDANGRLVYRGALALIRPNIQQSGRGGGAPVMTAPDFPDSTAIVRVDLASRRLDTAAFFKIAPVKMKTEQTDRGISMTSETNPLPLVDDWAVLADGSIAIVRGQDYHVDFIDAASTTSRGPKLPFDWQRLDDDAKVALIDSVKKAYENARAVAASAPAGGAAVSGSPDGAPRMVINMTTAGGGDGGGGLAQRIMANGMGAGAAALGNVSFVAPADLPDYRPAFGPGAARGDADDNLWIRTTATRPGAAGSIYDIVNRRGELVDRVQLPPGRQIVGFGKGGVVYMLARDASGGWIERTHR
jgi:hypothetical protein